MEAFIRDIRTTGAVSPCSQAVADALAYTVDLKKCKTVIELGAGTGAITKTLEHAIADETLFLALELNPEFAEYTQRLCPRAIVYTDTAERINFYLDKHGRNTCECVISTLPWSIFTKDQQDNIIHAIVDALPEGGDFLAVTYMFSALLPGGLRFRKLLKNNFSEVNRSQIVWKNLPPVLVYHCKK